MIDSSLENRAVGVAQRNGKPVLLGDLVPLAFAGYAHFTAMQARNASVRGLDLHLARLRDASQSMFGQYLPDDAVRSALRLAMASTQGDCSLLATVYSPAGEFTASDGGSALQILVRTSPASVGPRGPLSLGIFAHERMLPEIKHVGEIAKTWFLRQAVAQGFDDAAFIDQQGRLSEASIWNLVFWDGSSVIWPHAAMLRGTMMGIVARQLDRLGIPQRHQAVRVDDLPKLAGAAVMNSWTPGVAVNRLGPVAMPDAPEFLGALHAACKAEPWLES